MKQKNGGFTVCSGGEQDIRYATLEIRAGSANIFRGAYCAMTVIVLLNLPLELPSDSPARVKGDETFLTGLPEWIGRCQTYEGGIADSPGNEAHGAYAFCGLACLSILGPPKLITKYVSCTTYLPII
jgi:protein farnesyltransferase subunit beta